MKRIKNNGDANSYLTTYETVNWKVNPLGDICIWINNLYSISTHEKKVAANSLCCPLLFKGHLNTLSLLFDSILLGKFSFTVFIHKSFSKSYIHFSRNSFYFYLSFRIFTESLIVAWGILGTGCSVQLGSGGQCRTMHIIIKTIRFEKVCKFKQTSRILLRNSNELCVKCWRQGWKK